MRMINVYHKICKERSKIEVFHFYLINESLENMQLCISMKTYRNKINIYFIFIVQFMKLLHLLPKVKRAGVKFRKIDKFCFN